MTRSEELQLDEFNNDIIESKLPKDLTVTTIDLSWLGLTRLTEASITTLVSYPALKVLYLNGNELTSLPDSIGQLTGLKTLYLGTNQITRLPDSIGQLGSLKTLSLRCNKFTTLPDSIGQLTGLETLDLDQNRLTRLPDSIGQLAGLQTLYLRGNKLSQVELSKLRTNKQTFRGFWE